jgi:hypothetical protein
MLGSLLLEYSVADILSVQEVQPDKVIISVKDPKNKDAKPEIREISAGFVLWSTGIGELCHGCCAARLTFKP